MIGVIVTGTTLVVTISQLVLSQENEPLGDQRKRMSNTMDFRTLPFTLRKGNEHKLASDRGTAKMALERTQWEQLSFDVDTTGLINVTNESHETPSKHHDVATIDDVANELMVCTCPHHVYRYAYCRRMAAVETATNDGTLTAFPSDDEKTSQLFI